MLRADAALELEGVALEEGKKVRDGEGEFGERKTGAKVADGVGDDFEGLWAVGAFERFSVLGFDELAPGIPDVDGVAVVGRFVDEDAEIVVACLVGILIE